MDIIATPTVRLPRQVWNFTRHFLEMCIAMCIGGSILLVVLTAVVTQLGQPALRDSAPGLAVLVTAAIYTPPMAAWMLFRGMTVRPTVEMAAATMAVGVALVGRRGWASSPTATSAAGLALASAVRPAWSCCR